MSSLGAWHLALLSRRHRGSGAAGLLRGPSAGGGRRGDPHCPRRADRARRGDRLGRRQRAVLGLAHRVVMGIVWPMAGPTGTAAGRRDRG
jgi:hypothetical protein